MPTYVYETIPADTKTSPRRFEVEQRMSAAALTHDPESGLPVRRIISGGIGFIGAAKDQSPSPCGMGACGSSECPLPPPSHTCGAGCSH